MRVGHHVADDLDPAGDALALERRPRALVGARRGAARARSTSIRLRSSGIERSPLRRPGLDVGERDAAPRRRRARRRASSSCRRRRAPSPAAPLERGGDPRLHRARVGGVQVEPVLRLRQVELVEEDLRELAVLVLAGVQDDLLDPAVAQRDRERRRLHELRPVADDGEGPHRGRGRRGRIGATLAAARSAPALAVAPASLSLGDPSCVELQALSRGRTA